MYHLCNRLQTSAKPKTPLGQKFNFLTRETIHFAEKNKVRTRAVGRDRFAGLRGRAYLDARASEPKLEDIDIPVTPSWLLK